MFVLRPATAADLPRIQNLERVYCEQGFVGADPLDVHERELASPDCSYSIIEQQGAWAGFVILRGLTSRNRCIELKRVAIVTPGGGLGRQVLRAVMARAFGELGAHRLWLDVYPENTRARHLYQSLGFVEEGVMRDCVLIPDGRYRSLILMSMLEDECLARRTY